MQLKFQNFGVHFASGIEKTNPSVTVTILHTSFLK